VYKQGENNNKGVRIIRKGARTIGFKRYPYRFATFDTSRGFDGDTDVIEDWGGES